MFISFRNKLGWMFIAVFSLAPLGFWYVMKPLSLRFYDITSTLTSLGQIFGLLGMAMFVITLTLSARAKFIENCFGGMDRVYKAHHLLGGISFLLLLFHPLVLAFKFARISFKEAALFLLPGSNNAINFGIIALVILITLLFLTYFSKLRYHIWKLSHKFLGLAFFFAIFHTFFAASDVARNLPLKIYMAGLVVLGISAFLYRTLIGWVLVTKFNYTVVNIKEMSDQTMEIEMASKDKALKFLPGQFAYFNFYSQGIKTESHPFSISSGLNDTNLKIAVKALGDYTASLKNL
ncbi:MAG: ferric reductase-like transmembrane domain-containing protein, partial [Candidatus Gribaldobacteria bacterium]|nr:ferric reductase-like transmembrane domain-containing protein [Candidatus Gribaldobacteria bacterium]